MARRKAATQPLFGIDSDDVERADIQIREKQQEVKYDTRDFVIGWIVDEFNASTFFIPEYQRQYVWPVATRCRFIESVLLGLPIPMMFFADQADGRLEIVDGAQRVQTLHAFMQGNLTLSDLKRLDTLNGFTFKDLPKGQQQRFRSRALRSIVLEVGTTNETRQEIFHRINSSGMRATPAEIRRGAFAGPFSVFVQSCAADPKFRRLCPLSETQMKRKENEELVLRFFAYSDRYLEFQHDVGNFLDQYFQDKATSFNEKVGRIEFQRMLKTVEEVLPHGFSKTVTATMTPRVRFEAIAVGINLALRINPTARPNSVAWLSSAKFAKLVETDASNSSTRLRARVEFVRDRWLNLET